jgi:acetyl-CoA synthetase
MGGNAAVLIAHAHEMGPRNPRSHDLYSIRLLGPVGEPINPEAWRWYREANGADEGEQCTTSA